MISMMKCGSVVVDVAIDHGGCSEASHAIPAAVPHTSPFALTNATFPYLLELANKGVDEACRTHPALCAGLNTYRGAATHKGVAESQGRPWKQF